MLLSHLTGRNFERDPDIEGIAYDSRKVGENYLFVAIRGFNVDGHDFIPRAIEKGAVAIAHESHYSPPQEFRQRAVFIEVENSRKFLSMVSSRFFGEPSRKLKVIGITGTNGKTTTAFLIHQVLNWTGNRCGLMGTVLYDTVCRKEKASLTTPESLEIHAMMKEILECGGTHHVMEVSSHSLALHRVDHVDFDVAVFTNLTQDHLDFHGSMDEYLKAKLKLFRMLDGDDYAVINADDPHASHFEKASTGRVITYGFGEGAMVRGEVMRNNLEEGLVISLEVEGSIYIIINHHLLGEFNAYNLLAAFTTLMTLDIPPATAVEFLSKARPPKGRLQRIKNVFIDYAHTPDALENVLRTLKPLTGGKLIVVFGAGGNRDREKRPLMGEVAGRYADVIILTNDNPRWEDPMEIIRDIERGINREHHVEPDREKAIKMAIDMADEKDIVLIAGKGHETYQEIRGERLPFDDEQVVRKYLNEFDMPTLEWKPGEK